MICVMWGCSDTGCTKCKANSKLDNCECVWMCLHTISYQISPSRRAERTLEDSVKALAPKESTLSKEIETWRFAWWSTAAQREVHQCLTQLNTIDTRDVVIKEIRCIIEKTLCLSSLSEHRKGTSHHSKDQEVALIGFIAHIYRDKLLETVPNLLETLIRMAEIKEVYFKDLKREIHIASENS
jgi:hypothetical protein